MPEAYFRILSNHLTHYACRWEDLHLTPGQDQILPHPVVVPYNSWRIQMRSIFGCVPIRNDHNFIIPTRSRPHRRVHTEIRRTSCYD